MALSPAWKKKMSVYALIIVLDIVVLAFSVSVNVFQEFFFEADLFPLFLSIATLVILLLQIAFDLASENAFTARPVFEVPLLGTLTIAWLVSNSFSTSRYTGLPNCAIFSDDVDGEQSWCRNAQGLRVLIWVEWIALLAATLMLTRTAIVQARRGNTAVWRTALSRYHRNNQSRDFLQEASSFYRGSSIFGFDRASDHQKSSSRDWFAPAEPSIRMDDQRDNGSGSFFGAGTSILGTPGNGTQSAVSLHHPQSIKDTTVAKTIDGFEIVSTGYYFQNEGIWNKSGPQWKS